MGGGGDGRVLGRLADGGRVAHVDGELGSRGELVRADLTGELYCALFRDREGAQLVERHAHRATPSVSLYADFELLRRIRVHQILLF